jgi:hypothetical protein
MQTDAQLHHTGTSGSGRDAGTIVGVVLVALGGLLLASQLWGFALLDWGRDWPLVVVATGLLLGLGLVQGGRAAAGLAYPASIVTTVGLILLCQSYTGAWQTWAYAWVLAGPTAVGVGHWLHGRVCDDPAMQARGRRAVEAGLALFAGLAAFFELVLNLSGFFAGTVAGSIVALLLVAAGAYLLLRDRIAATQ